MFDQVFEQTIGKALLVGPGSVTEDAPQLGVVGRLYGAKGVDDGLADVLSGFSDIGPMGTVGNGEAVVLGQGRELFVAARGLRAPFSNFSFPRSHAVSSQLKPYFSTKTVSLGIT